MGIVQKQGLFNSILSYTGIILGFLLVVFIFPRYLEVSEFGVRSLMVDAVYILGQFSLFGLPMAGIRVFPKFQKVENGKNQFFTFICIIFIAFLAIFLLIYSPLEPYIFHLFSQNSPQFTQNKFLLIPLLIGITLGTTLDMFNRVNLTTIFSNYVREVQTRGLTISIVFLFGFHYLSIGNFWIAFVCVYFINIFTLFTFIFKEHNIRFAYPKAFLNDQPFLKEFFTFCLFASLTGIGAMIVLKIDTMMIGKYISEEKVGIYTLGIFLSSLIDVPRKALIQMSAPIISQLWNDQNFERMNEFYKKSSTNMQFAGTVIFLCIWCNIDDFFLFIPKGDIYSTGKYVVLIIGLGKLMDMSFGVNSDIITFSKKYQIGLYFNLGLAGLAVLLNFLLIQKWGINGVAVGSALSLFAINISRFLYIKYKYKLSPFSFHNIYLGLVLVSFLTIAHFIHFPFHPVLNIGLKSLLIGLTFLFIIFKTNWVIDVREMILGILRKKKIIK